MSWRGDPSAAMQALVHHDEAVAQLLRLIHVVGRDDERHAGLLEPEQLVPQHVAGLRVEAGGRLVEQQQVGVVDQAAGDREAALHAAGQVLDLRLRLLGDLRELQQLLRALAAGGTVDAEVAAVDVEVVEHVELVVERVLLRAHAEPATDRRAVGGGVHAEDPQLAGAHRAHRRDHPHRARLAGTVGAEEAERLATAHLHVDALDGLEVAERLAQSPCRDHGFCHRRRP